MVNDLNHTHRKKPKLALPTSKSHDNFSDTLYPFSDNQTSSINNTNGITSLPRFYTKRSNKFRLTRFKFFPKRQPLSQPTSNYRTSMLPCSQEQTPTLPIYPTTNPIQHDNYIHQHDNITTQHDNSTDNTFVKNGTNTPIKIYSKTNYPFLPPSFQNRYHSAFQTDIEHFPSTFNIPHHYSSQLISKSKFTPKFQS